MSDNVYDLETIDGLPEELRRMVPLPERRRQLQVGKLARLFVFVAGRYSITPWVTIVEIKPGIGYVGEVGGVLNSPNWLPFGTLVAFTYDNIIDCEE